MSWAVLIVRWLVGLAFLVFGLNHFLTFMPAPDPSAFPEAARHMMGALVPTHYLTVVKVLEVVGGLLLLTGRLAPLGLVVLVPVTVNIALWDALIVRYAMPPVGTILLALEGFLVWAYRRYFAGVLTTSAAAG